MRIGMRYIKIYRAEYALGTPSGLLTDQGFALLECIPVFRVRVHTVIRQLSKRARTDAVHPFILFTLLFTIYVNALTD